MANKFADPNEPLQYPGVMKTYPGMVKGQPPVYGKSLFGTYDLENIYSYFNIYTYTK